MRNVPPAPVGGGTRIEPGSYVCKVTGGEENTFSETVILNMTITEGPSAGASFKVWLNYGNDKDQKRTSQRLQAFAESNPGFDPVAAWDAGQWNLFTGRIAGVVFNEVEKNKDGKTYVNVDAGAVVSVQSLRDGTAPAPQHRTADGRYISLQAARAAEQSAEATAAAVAAYDWQGNGDTAYRQQPTQYAPGGYMAQQAAAIPASSIPF